MTKVARTLPEKCRRRQSDCQPLHAIESDDKSTFVCCGLRCPQDVSLEQAVKYSDVALDPYRVCQRSATLQSVEHLDEFDMLDTIEVMTRAMSTVRRMREAQ